MGTAVLRKNQARGPEKVVNAGKHAHVVPPKRVSATTRETRPKLMVTLCSPQFCRLPRWPVPPRAPCTTRLLPRTVGRLGKHCVRTPERSLATGYGLLAVWTRGHAGVGSRTLTRNRCSGPRSNHMARPCPPFVRTRQPWLVTNCTYLEAVMAQLTRMTSGSLTRPHIDGAALRLPLPEASCRPLAAPTLQCCTAITSSSLAAVTGRLL